MNTRKLLPSVLLAAALAAQDPTPPPGGFPVSISRDNVLAWSDGYRTYLDVLWPNYPTPATGWPVILVVHGGDNSRNVGWVKETQLMMAKAGYAALAYDVRGDGDTGRLNNPNLKGSAARVLADMADCFYQAELRQPAILDERRLAVYGQSQGGGHAFRAAAFSQSLLPLPGYTTHMPRISASITDIQTMNGAEEAVPQGIVFGAHGVVKVYEEGGAAHPQVLQFLAGDTVGYRAAVTRDPAGYFLPQLQQSDVPLFVMNSYDDGHHLLNTNPDSMPTLRPGVPRRFYVTTGGHGSQNNDVEYALSMDYIRRWCDRFLKAIPNLVEQEPFAEVAVMPADPARYGNARSYWQHRLAPAWPANTATTRRFLRAPGRLEVAPPAVAEPSPLLAQRVLNGYTALQFLVDGGGPGRVLPNLPLVSLAFDAPPAPQEIELFGRPVVELDVSTAATTFQIAATLYDVPPAGPARYITSGITGKRNVAPGRHRLRIEVSDIAYVLPRGHVLRLALENVWLRQQAGHVHFVIAPEFQSYDLRVHVDPMFAPHVDLPLREPECSLTPRVARVSAAAGIDHALAVEGEPLRAGDFHAIVLGGSGITPGTNLGVTIPINVDAWTFAGLIALNTPTFQSFAGSLGALGRSQGRFVVPAPLANVLAGTRLDFAVLGVHQGTSIFTSAPATLVIDP